MQVISEEYKGYTLIIEYDEYADCPWDAWDCNPPIAVKSFHYHSVSIDTKGDEDVMDWQEFMTEEIAVKRWADIKEAFDGEWTYEDDEEEITERMECYGVSRGEAMLDIVLGQDCTDDLDVVAELYSIMGIPALRSGSQGYSQGDYVEVLVVLTPKFLKEWGVTEEHYNSCMEGAVKLYGYWTWGQVYSYAVEDEEGETLESCCGFYGDTDYPLNEAKDTVDHIVQAAKEDEERELEESCQTLAAASHAWHTEKVVRQGLLFC